MINKKLVALAAATMVVSTLFVGCGGSKTEDASTEGTSTENATVKTVEIPGEEDTTIVELTLENGTPVAVNIDTKMLMDQ